MTFGLYFEGTVGTTFKVRPSRRYDFVDGEMPIGGIDIFHYDFLGVPCSPVGFVYEI